MGDEQADGLGQFLKKIILDFLISMQFILIYVFVSCS